jgi:N-succinyldiaminopimelate aminotransferase
MKPANSVLGSFGTTVFEVMSRLAIEHGSINLGQGFPDDSGPNNVLEKAATFLYDPPNQYPPMLGVPELRQAVALHNKRFYEIDVDWETETMVSTGATEALAACFFGLIEPGDEVVLIEPLYDCYLPIIKRAGGVPKMVTIKPPEWKLDPAELRAAFSTKTKLLLLNTPQNPASKVYSYEELKLLAGLVKEFDAIAICDEVYEHMVFDGQKHIPLMTLPGMRDRTIRIGSAGKTFSLTGWKVGYLTGSQDLISAVAKAHQFLVFTTAPNLQRAVAFGLNQSNEYFDQLNVTMKSKRDKLNDALARIPGFKPAICQGTYFLFVDIAGTGFSGDDVAFCKYITTEVGVTAVPVSAFYKTSGTDTFIRFCFAKQDSLLNEAVLKLTTHFG